MRITLFLIVLGTILTSFKGANDQRYQLDVTKTLIGWVGHKYFGGQHTGTIQVSEGTLVVIDGKLNSGEFVIDMNSIKVTDLEGATAEKLADHLKTDDFFDAVNYPKATFQIKHVDYAGENRAAVLGDLTIRGITQQINFPIEISVVGGTLHATAKEIRVDRTVHEAKYGSVSFFRDLGRKIVSDEFTLAIELVASVK